MGPVGDPGRTPIDPLQPLINPVDLFLVEPILLRGRRRMGWDGCVSPSFFCTKENDFAGTYNKFGDVNVPDDDAANYLEYKAIVVQTTKEGGLGCDGGGGLGEGVGCNSGFSNNQPLPAGCPSVLLLPGNCTFCNTIPINCRG